MNRTNGRMAELNGIVMRQCSQNPHGSDLLMRLADQLKRGRKIVGGEVTGPCFITHEMVSSPTDRQAINILENPNTVEAFENHLDVAIVHDDCHIIVAVNEYAADRALRRCEEQVTA